MWEGSELDVAEGADAVLVDDLELEGRQRDRAPLPHVRQARLDG